MSTVTLQHYQGNQGGKKRGLGGRAPTERVSQTSVSLYIHTCIHLYTCTVQKNSFLHIAWLGRSAKYSMIEGLKAERIYSLVVHGTLLNIIN